MSLELFPLNPLAFVATLKTMDDTGALVPLETGTVTAFLADSADPTAVAVDGSLSVSAVYTGSLGKWVVRFPAAILTPALLATKFGSADAFCILQASTGVRAAVPLAYVPSYVVEASA